MPSQHVQSEQEVHILSLEHCDAAVEEGWADLITGRKGGAGGGLEKGWEMEGEKSE